MASLSVTRVLCLTTLVLYVWFGSAAGHTVKPSSESVTGEKRITGGHESVPGAWPWMAGIFVRGVKNFFKCGATLISTQWVVTAAHCTIINLKMIVLAATNMPEIFKVRLGEHDMDTSDGFEQEYQVKRVVVHPQWTVDKNKTPAGVKLYTSHDIALLELGSAVNLSERVKPIDLDTRQHFRAGKLCYTAGWGTETLTSAPLTILHEVALPLVSRTECNALKSYSGIITKDMLCAGYREGGKDTCTGDSGGPLMCEGDDKKWYLAGVASFGHNGCGLPFKYGVYTRITCHVDWISRTTGMNLSKAHKDNMSCGLDFTYNRTELIKGSQA